MNARTAADPFLAAALLAAALLAETSPGQTHTHGDMVGSITPGGCVVWTRSSAPADVSVEYATSPVLSGARSTPPFRTSGVTDFVARFRLSALAAGTRYYYRTRVADPTNPGRFVLGPISSFVTAPDPNAPQAPATICFIGDIADKSLYHMFDRILQHRPDLCLNLGDFPYADGANQIGEYWQKHRLVRDEPRLWNFYRSVGVAAIWDDHEVENDWDANTSPLRATNGTLAWKNYFPLEPPPAEIYHRLRWGAHAEFFLLDCRSHRGSNEAPDLPGKTMLGAVQRDWLKGALATSTATFKIVCTSVPLRYGTTDLDSWDGYQRERAELLGFVRERKIDGVVFLTADQHWAAVHHHREGVREFQSGPLATGTRPPLPHADPERVLVFQEINYGLVRIDPQSTPPTLTVELHGAAGLLHREVIPAAAPARCEVLADLPEAGFTATGPVLVRDSNTLAVRERLEPGTYALRFPAVPGVPTAPESIDLTVLPGADLRVAARWRDLPDRQHPILLNQTFAGPLVGFQVIDEGTVGAPSAWFTDNGYLQQSSNIYGGSLAGSDPVKPGTMAITGSPQWTDYTVQVRVRSKDDDAVGVVFRYRDQANYYRFSSSAAHGYQRLTRKVGGVVTVLAERAGSYGRHEFQDLRITAVGRRLTVYLDGVRALVADDPAHPSGRVGLYTWGNFLTEFDDLVVRQGEVQPPSGGFPGALLEDRFDDGQVQGWTISDQGTISAPSNWTETGGRFRQLSNIYGGSMSGAVLPKPGTMAVATRSLPADLYFAASLNDPDDDGMGVVFRFVDAANHYRFSWDAQRSYRRLAKVVAGRWTVQREDTTPFVPGRTYRVAVQVEGRRIRVHVDGALFADVMDGSHTGGGIGLYCWGSAGLSFDDVLVLPPLSDPSRDPRTGNGIPRPVLTAQLAGRVTGIVGRHLPSRGLPYGLALSFARAPGIPLSILNPADPREIELALDALFLWSLTTPTPILSGFSGTVDAQGYLRGRLVWPNLPGTKGAVIYCAGWITDAGRTTVREILPSVAIVFP